MIAGDRVGATGKVVLVVEDEYFLAKEIAAAVRQAGGSVLGPVPDVARALEIVANRVVDVAVLDIQLGQEVSFPIATALREKGVQMVFVTGYDDWFLPDEFKTAPVFRKPVDADKVVKALLEAGS